MPGTAGHGHGVFHVIPIRTDKTLVGCPGV